jgi:trans-aconitate methyltransferase
VTPATDFDQFAHSYDRALSEALAASGEDRSYFARGRVRWLARCLREMACTPRHIMDYGCGVGTTTPLLLELLGAQSAVGVDLSDRSLEVARQNHESQRVRFCRIQSYKPDGTCDLAYCNGVVHHIPPPERPEALHFVLESVRPGGLFALWENNPWNPGTRHVMAHCAFDRDAITLTAGEAKRLLQSAGFEILRTDFLFIFPRILKLLRPTERLVAKLPLGAQYQILCRKPDV